MLIFLGGCSYTATSGAGRGGGGPLKHQILASGVQQYAAVDVKRVVVMSPNI